MWRDAARWAHVVHVPASIPTDPAYNWRYALRGPTRRHNGATWNASASKMILEPRLLQALTNLQTRGTALPVAYFQRIVRDANDGTRNAQRAQLCNLD
jgi:hypothetical protein